MRFFILHCIYIKFQEYLLDVRQCFMFCKIDNKFSQYFFRMVLLDFGYFRTQFLNNNEKDFWIPSIYVNPYVVTYF